MHIFFSILDQVGAHLANGNHGNCSCAESNAIQFVCDNIKWQKKVMSHRVAIQSHFSHCRNRRKLIFAPTEVTVIFLQFFFSFSFFSLWSALSCFKWHGEQEMCVCVSETLWVCASICFALECMCPACLTGTGTSTHITQPIEHSIEVRRRTRKKTKLTHIRNSSIIVFLAKKKKKTLILNTALVRFSTCFKQLNFGWLLFQHRIIIIRHPTE